MTICTCRLIRSAQHIGVAGGGDSRSGLFEELSERRNPMFKLTSLPVVPRRVLLVVLLMVPWVLAPGTAGAQQSERAPCKVELILTEVEVVQDTDLHAID